MPSKRGTATGEVPRVSATQADIQAARVGMDETQAGNQSAIVRREVVTSVADARGF